MDRIRKTLLCMNIKSFNKSNIHTFYSRMLTINGYTEPISIFVLNAFCTIGKAQRSMPGLA